MEHIATYPDLSDVIAYIRRHSVPRLLESVVLEMRPFLVWLCLEIKHTSTGKSE